MTLMPQFVNGLHGKHSVKRAVDVSRPVLGFEAGKLEAGCRESGKTFPTESKHVLGEVQEGVALERRASIQHPMCQEAWSRTKFKDASTRGQRRDDGRNVISDLRAPGPLLISGTRPARHHGSAAPIVAVRHIVFL